MVVCVCTTRMNLSMVRKLKNVLHFGFIHVYPLALVPALRAGPSQQINLYCSNHGILSICMSHLL